jgi:D-3-phosphoglycerate dehydrogenase
VNIAAMQVGRDTAGGQAVSVLTLDSVPAAGVIEDVAREIGARSVHLVDLSESE